MSNTHVFLSENSRVSVWSVHGCTEMTVFMLFYGFLIVHPFWCCEIFPNLWFYEDSIFRDIRDYVFEIVENISFLHTTEIYGLAISPDFSLLGIVDFMYSTVSWVITDETIVPHSVWDYRLFQKICNRERKWYNTSTKWPLGQSRNFRKEVPFFYIGKIEWICPIISENVPLHTFRIYLESLLVLVSLSWERMHEYWIHPCSIVT